MIDFTFSALLGPVFGARLTNEPGLGDDAALSLYQAGFKPLPFGIVGALVLTIFLKETGAGARKTGSIHGNPAN